MQPAALLSLSIRTLADARNAAQQAAALCAQAQRVEAGLAELLVNAVEHGNLGIDHAHKAALLEAGEWEAEVARRLDDPKLGRRRARLAVWRTGQGWRFEVTDQGDGFVWSSWLAPDPQRSAAPNGRGIALAAGLYFDVLRFHAPGNRVVAELYDAAGAGG